MHRVWPVCAEPNVKNCSLGCIENAFSSTTRLLSLLLHLWCVSMEKASIFNHKHRLSARCVAGAAGASGYRVLVSGRDVWEKACTSVSLGARVTLVDVSTWSLSHWISHSEWLIQWQMEKVKTLFIFVLFMQKVRSGRATQVDTFTCIPSCMRFCISCSHLWAGRGRPGRRRLRRPGLGSGDGWRSHGWSPTTLRTHEGTGTYAAPSHYKTLTYPLIAWTCKRKSKGKRKTC